jgi:hypothetical protein
MIPCEEPVRETAERASNTLGGDHVTMACTPGLSAVFWAFVRHDATPSHTMLFSRCREDGGDLISEHGRHGVRILSLVVLATLAWAAQSGAEKLDIKKSWRGEIGVDAAKTVGEALVIVKQEAWEKFWKSLKRKDKAPAVDFKTQAVLVMSKPGITINFLDLNDGDIRPDADATFDGEPMFHAVVFERKGIKSVWRKALPAD